MITRNIENQERRTHTPRTAVLLNRQYEYVLVLDTPGNIPDRNSIPHLISPVDMRCTPSTPPLLLSSNRPTRAQPRNSAAEAAAREKSSAEYLRRRLKEAEVALKAKAARRDLLKSGLRKRDLREGGADSGGDGGNNDNVDGGRVRWAQRSRKMVGGALEETDANGGESVEATRLREELRACRRKLAVASAEASRLRNEAAVSRRVEREKEEEQEAEQGRARAPLPDEACYACGQRNQIRWVAVC